MLCLKTNSEIYHEDGRVQLYLYYTLYYTTRLID